MYQRLYPGNPKLQCLICGKENREIDYLYFYFHPQMICGDCYSKFHILYKHERIADLRVLILYEYDDYFRGLLFRYKASYDHELRKIFLAPFKDLLHRKYKDYVIVPAPSSKLANEIRGFKPMLEIAKELGNPVIDCLYKIDEYKQSEHHYIERKNIQEHVQIKDIDLKNQKVLWIDDVATSYCTMKTCIALLKSKHPKCIQVLLLSKRLKRE